MIVALAGGVGGAKLSQGLALAVSPGELTVIVNTADDLDLFGLRICPDLDTVLYTLGGIANPATGWGILGDTHHTLSGIEKLGQSIWFQLGDRDFATHILRTEQLRAGRRLSSIVTEFATALGISSTVLPMTDAPVATKIETAAGLLDFQDYFVARRQEDDVLGITFEGAGSAVPAAGTIEAIHAAEIVVLCPSNPLVSIGPILAITGFRDALVKTNAPIVAVSPIVGGKALKGPADKMLATLGHDVSALGVARLYADFIDGMVIDDVDADLATAIESLGVKVLTTQSIMGDPDDRKRLAEEVLAFGRSIHPLPVFV